MAGTYPGSLSLCSSGPDSRCESAEARRQYDAIHDALEQAGGWPADGCRLHVCFGDEQDVRVSEVWESREELQAFGEKLGSRLNDAGIELSGEPEVFEATNIEVF